MISDSATAVTTAPPSPCTARATTSIACEFASPHASEASVNSTMPEQEQPAVAVQIAQPAAEQQEAAEGQHVGVDDPHQRGLGEAEVLRIDGSATFTIVVSSTIISTPRHSTISASQRFLASSSMVKTSLPMFSLQGRHEATDSGEPARATAKPTFCTFDERAGAGST